MRSAVWKVPVEKVGVIGGGSWGTALAKLLVEKGCDVTLWIHSEEVYRQAFQERENRIYLPKILLPRTLRVTQFLPDAVGGKQAIVAVTPSHAFREVMTQAFPFCGSAALLISATKGIEEKSLRTMSQVLQELGHASMSRNVAVLSGPSFAREVARGIPTAVTVAAHDEKVAEDVQSLFSVPYFRVYTSTDVLGVELGGAVKNIIALAAGVSDGLGFGYNTRAALITRGLAEMTRLAEKMGANPRTLSGLSGLGDLVLTCTGDLSRNRTVGMRIGKGEQLQDILRGMRMVAEGIPTTRSVYFLARKLGIEMPITDQIYLLLYEDKPAREVVRDLLQREAKPEIY